MRQPPFRNQHLFTAHTFAKPLPTVLSRAFPTLPQFQFHSKEKSHSNSLVAEQPVSGAPKPRQGLTPLRARNAGLRLSNDPRKYAQAKRWSASRAAVLPQKHPSRVPPQPGHRTSPPHRRGRRAERMRAALPGVPATLPPTHSESLSLPALAPSPSGVSQSLPVAAEESLLPPSYPLSGGSSGSSWRGRRRKRETDLIKFPETATTTKKGPRWGETPILPRPSPKA